MKKNDPKYLKCFFCKKDITGLTLLQMDHNGTQIFLHSECRRVMISESGMRKMFPGYQDFVYRITFMEEEAIKLGCDYILIMISATESGNYIISYPSKDDLVAGIKNIVARFIKPHTSPIMFYAFVKRQRMTVRAKVDITLVKQKRQA